MTKWDFLRFWQRPSSANKKKSLPKQEGGDSRPTKSIRRNCQVSRNMEDITNRTEIDLDYKMSLMKKSQSWEPSIPHPRVLRKIAAYEKDYLPSGMIPEPDYDQEDDIHEKKNQKDLLVDENGLILPRKPSNPCLTSTERRDLHRELLFNQKRGINVLNQKTELQKALEKHNDSKQKKIAEAEKELNKSCFEKMLAQQAKKLEERTTVVQSAPGSNELNSEFLKVHAKVRARMNSE